MFLIPGIIKEYILRKYLASNAVIESIKLALNSDNKAIDATSMKNKIENLLSSIINNDVISQKMFGDMKVMGTSAGWETKPRVVNGRRTAALLKARSGNTVAKPAVANPMEIQNP